MAGIDGWLNPVGCFYLSKEDCGKSPGCEWSYRGHCRPDYAKGPLRTKEDAVWMINRVLRVLEEVPPDMFQRAAAEARYLVNALPKSPAWSRVPWEVRWYIMTEGKENVYEAIYKRAQSLGIRTRVRPLVAEART